jgi:AhpD family alkylhydroperoxidase
MVRTSPDSLAETGIDDEIRAAFGVMPEPLSLHAPLPALKSAVWGTLRETVVVDRHLPRAVKEAMAVAVSAANRCAYCVDAHALALHATGAGDIEVAQRHHHLDRLDPRTRDLISWAARSGRAGPPGDRVPCAPEALPEAIGTVLCFHYVNRLVTILLAPTLLPFGGSALRPAVLRVTAALLRWRVRAQRPAAPIPASTVPAQLAWAAPTPAIARAFAGLDAAVATAAGFLQPASRGRLDAVLAAWDGSDPPIGRRWLDEASTDVSPEDRPAFRLMLLAALAPHRVVAGDLDAVRAQRPEPSALLGVLAFASFAAARRISQWWMP